MWNRPKRTIRRLGLILASVSLILAIGWMVLAYMWTQHPTEIHKWDSKIPDYYKQTLDSYKDELKTVNTKDKQSAIYYEFLDEFENMTSLNKDYNLLVDAYLTLIDNHLLKGESQEALELAKSWEKKYPFEFRAKFKYHDLLKQQDPTVAHNYIEALYSLYPDVIEVSTRRVFSLIENQSFEEGLKAALKQKSDYFNNSIASFMFFYRDKDHKAFHANTKVELPLKNIQREGSRYLVTMQRKIQGFRGLRIDLDGLRVGSLIRPLQFNIEANGKNYSDLEYKPLSQLKQLEKGVFSPTGSDPYFEIFLPEELKNKDADVFVEAHLQIENQAEFIINSLFASEEWQFYYSPTKDFSEELSVRFPVNMNISKSAITLDGEADVDPAEYEYLRVDLPALVGMESTKFVFRVNDEKELNVSDVIAQHSVVLLNEGIKVHGKDPHLIFKLEDPVKVDRLTLELYLGEFNE